MRTAIAALTFAATFLPHAPADAAPRSHGEDPSSVPSASSARALPPITVSVYVAPHVPQSTVTRLLAEAADVWRPNGITFLWVPGPEEVAPYGRAGEDGRYRPSTLRVSIDYERGDPRRDRLTPLGWIRFDRPGEPDQVIHVSYANATSLLEASALVVGPVGTMPKLERELYLARAMGRALAHELGHYLLASKVHTVHGLMQAGRTAGELFGRERVHFELDAAQKEVALSRLMQTMTLTRR
ncbi:MAG TPA: hypothetical protein VG222_17155 [Vicinamibacterales bacterium]|nr:hypothetical protein [Vicinamibacterales bacterium]